MCSFRHRLQPLTRSEQLQFVYQQCAKQPGAENDIAYVFQLLRAGFKQSFSSWQDREQLYRKFVAQTSKVLDEAGFKYYRAKIFYFPPDDNNSE